MAPLTGALVVVAAFVAFLSLVPTQGWVMLGAGLRDVGTKLWWSSGVVMGATACVQAVLVPGWAARLCALAAVAVSVSSLWFPPSRPRASRRSEGRRAVPRRDGWRGLRETLAVLSVVLQFVTVVVAHEAP